MYNPPSTCHNSIRIHKNFLKIVALSITLLVMGFLGGGVVNGCGTERKIDDIDGRGLYKEKYKSCLNYLEVTIQVWVYALCRITIIFL